MKREGFLNMSGKKVFAEAHSPVVSLLSLLMFHQTFRKVSQLSSQRLSFLPVEINCWSNSWVGLWRNYHIHCYHDEVWICHGAMHMQWKCIKNWWNTICKNREHSSSTLCKHSICLCQVPARIVEWWRAGKCMVIRSYEGARSDRRTSPTEEWLWLLGALGPLSHHMLVLVLVCLTYLYTLALNLSKAKHILVVSMSQSSPPHIFHL